MTEQLTITTERIDDISLLLTQSEGIGIPELLDEHFKPHCNWEGLSLSWTTAVCLTYMVSEGDQRMNLVQPWVGRRLKIVQTCTGQDVCERSWRNDRLAIVLTLFCQVGSKLKGREVVMAQLRREVSSHDPSETSRSDRDLYRRVLPALPGCVSGCAEF